MAERIEQYSYPADSHKDAVVLEQALFKAHHEAVFRDNISSVTVINAMIGSGSYIQAIASAILTLGGLHAPIAQTMRVLSGAALPERIPGWGGSFQKDGPDPLFAPVVALLPAQMNRRIDEITGVLHARGKKIWPNPSAYTAAVALVLGIREELAPYLLIKGRLAGWTQLCAKQL